MKLFRDSFTVSNVLSRATLLIPELTSIVSLCVRLSSSGLSKALWWGSLLHAAQLDKLSCNDTACCQFSDNVTWDIPFYISLPDNCTRHSIYLITEFICTRGEQPSISVQFSIALASLATCSAVVIARGILNNIRPRNLERYMDWWHQWNINIGSNPSAQHSVCLLKNVI